MYVYASTFTIALLDIAKYFVLFWHAFTFDLVNCLYVRILILPWICLARENFHDEGNDGNQREILKQNVIM